MFSLDYQAQESHLLPLTLFSPKASVAMLNLFQPMRASSLVRWISLMLISSKVYLLRFQLIRNQLTEILAQLLEQSPRFMTICVCSLHVQEDHTVQIVARLLLVNHLSKSWIRFLSFHQQRSFRFWLQLSVHARVSLLSCSVI